MARTSFEGEKPSFTALPNWLAGRASALEIAVLWALQFHYPDIRPSLSRLATLTGLSRRTVMKVVADLERKGWISHDTTRTKGGSLASNRYQLRVWGGEIPDANPAPNARGRAGAALVEPRAGDALEQEMPHPPRAGAALGVGQELPGGRAGAALEEEQEKKNNSRKKKPPLSPASGGATAGPPLVNSPPDPNPSTASGPPDPSPGSAAPLPKAPRFRPTIESIPAGLLPVDREILEFWGHKAGRKSRDAWEYLLGQLERIQQHPQGGTEVVRLQLGRGIEADAAGKPWASVTFDNWWKYGREQQQRRVSQTSQAFANVSAFLDAVEAAKR